MSNSPLVVFTKLSPNYSRRTHAIDTITIHHMAGNLSIEACAQVFQTTSRQASSNYGIGTDGRIGLYVEEKNRAWTSSNRNNDNRAITIEVANSEVGWSSGWPISDAAMESLLNLCVDICQRNNIKKLNFTGDTTGNLTMHKWFANTACPGPYLEKRFPAIAAEVNKRLDAAAPKPSEPAQPVEPKPSEPATPTKRKTYRVQVGSFSSKSAAETELKKLHEAGFEGFIVEAEILLVDPPAPGATNDLMLLDKVRMAKNAPVYGTDRPFKPWVYSMTLYVREIHGDCIVVSTQRSGDVTGPVHRKYLTKV